MKTSFYKFYQKILRENTGQPQAGAGQAPPAGGPNTGAPAPAPTQGAGTAPPVPPVDPAVQQIMQLLTKVQDQKVKGTLEQALKQAGAGQPAQPPKPAAGAQAPTPQAGAPAPAGGAPAPQAGGQPPPAGGQPQAGAKPPGQQ